MKTEGKLYTVCDGRRVQWHDPEKIEEWKVFEILVEMRG